MANQFTPDNPPDEPLPITFVYGTYGDGNQKMGWIRSLLVALGFAKMPDDDED